MTGKRLILVACLTCGDCEHVPEGAPVAAWHLAHACPPDDDAPSQQKASGIQKARQAKAAAGGGE